MLWTLQTPGHQITSGTIDHTRSEYTHEIDGFCEAYQELWRRLGTPDGQIIWCSTEENGLVRTTDY